LDPNTDLHIVETTSIKVDISSNDDGLLNLGFAVNEVVFGHDIMGYHSFVISSEDGSFDDFTIKGSGLSVCTDLGSTGYNFNLGGSVLPLGSNLWSVVGVACNRYLNDILHTQKLVVSSSKESRSGFSVFTDGIKKRENMGSNQVAILRKGPTIKIAFLNETDFVRKRVDIASRYRKY
jgi:NAD kinase